VVAALAQGQIWWAELPDPLGSGPGFRRPVLVVQGNAFNRSRIGTVVVVPLTSNLRLAEAPGNVLLTARDTGLRRDSVVNVSQVITLDRALLTEAVGHLSAGQLSLVLAGIDLVLAGIDLVLGR
jgi:mRNA interferase MazF